MGNVSRKEEILREKKEMIGVKNTEIEIKNSLMGLLVESTQMRKESLKLRFP